jgi:hypothetical protein
VCKLHLGTSDPFGYRKCCLLRTSFPVVPRRRLTRTSLRWLPLRTPMKELLLKPSFQPPVAMRPSSVEKFYLATDFHFATRNRSAIETRRPSSALGTESSLGALILAPVIVAPLAWPIGMTAPVIERAGAVFKPKAKARLLAGRSANIPNVMKREHLRSRIDTSVRSLCNLGIGIWSGRLRPASVNWRGPLREVPTRPWFEARPPDCDGRSSTSFDQTSDPARQDLRGRRAYCGLTAFLLVRCA